ncbi:hypothetical protein Vadar_005992 [Vaccinium darrowii]|uniref:Uncharacterized protein n=1 Tax=Vaccinium darrowii TaxID=229202 RepID=A0ACB7Z2Q0_9ERIC|nr:hypothetical protein Vadar_005992 [Vaccinium darrowii]
MVRIFATATACSSKCCSIESRNRAIDVCNVNGDFSIIPSRFFMKMVARDGKGVGRKVIDTVHETYDTELAGKDFAYDGEKSLFTLGPLPRNKLEFRVVLEDVMSNTYGITVVKALEA